MADGGEPDEWVDRTNEPLREIGNGYELTPTLRSLYLTNNRISTIERLEVCSALRELVLRQNAIKVVQGLDQLHELVELDLYMNQVEELGADCFAGNPKLKRVDLSFNQLRGLKGFPSASLGNLEELYLIGNKIREISDLHSMPKLVMLELGDNRIRTIENLDALPDLQELWLGRNKITRIEGLEALNNLRKLSIQSNRIEKIEGLDHLVHLEELYLSHNGITSMNGVQNLANLRVLDLGENFIEHVEYVENLTLLQEFWINGNKLESFHELHLVKNAIQLGTVYLEQNPLAKHADYQAKALEILPKSLQQLDALLVEDVRVQLANAAATAPLGNPQGSRREEPGQGEIVQDVQPDGRVEEPGSVMSPPEASDEEMEPAKSETPDEESKSANDEMPDAEMTSMNVAMPDEETDPAKEV